MDKPVTINAEQRLYVVPCGNGYSCLGFDYMYSRTKAVSAWLGLEPPRYEAGTEAAYYEYMAVMAMGAARFDRTGERCSVELTPQLVGLEGCRVEVVDSYGNKRRFIVGKSTGWMPCHLELARVNSTGGTAVYSAPFKSVRVIKRNVR